MSPQQAQMALHPTDTALKQLKAMAAVLEQNGISCLDVEDDSLGKLRLESGDWTLKLEPLGGSFNPYIASLVWNNSRTGLTSLEAATYVTDYHMKKLAWKIERIKKVY